jgi:hypothetical protein
VTAELEFFAAAAAARRIEIDLLVQSFERSQIAHDRHKQTIVDHLLVLVCEFVEFVEFACVRVHAIRMLHTSTE